MAATAGHDGQIRATRAMAMRGAIERIDWRPVALALGALALLVWLGRDMTFYHDEFAFLLLRDLSPAGIFAPHNEHLSATLVVLYRTLVATVGTGSYWPYLGVTFALHLIVAGIVFVVVRREANAVWALGAMAVMLFLGSGGDDILWAFQSGTIGAVAAGLAAVVLAPHRPALAAVLLTIALATSGGGFAFLVGTAVHLALTRPRALTWLALPVGLYLAWYLGFGALRMAALRSPSTDGVPGYLLEGLAATAAGVVGFAAPVLGQFVLLVLAYALGRARAIPPVVLAMLVTSVAFFAIAGLVRAQLGAEQATAPRYIYIAAPGLLITGAILLARIPLPWRNAVGAALLSVALIGNVALLFETHDRLVSKIECEKTMTPVARGSAGNPC